MNEEKLLQEIRGIRGRKPQKGIKTPDIKKRTHDTFDPIWQSGKCTRKEAYCVIQLVLGIWVRKKAHIRYLDENQCRRLINAIEQGNYSITNAKAMNEAYCAPIYRRSWVARGSLDPQKSERSAGLWMRFYTFLRHRLSSHPVANTAPEPHQVRD